MKRTQKQVALSYLLRRAGVYRLRVGHVRSSRGARTAYRGGDNRSRRLVVGECERSHPSERQCRCGECKRRSRSSQATSACRARGSTARRDNGRGMPKGCTPTNLNNVDYMRCGSTYYKASMMGSNLVFWWHSRKCHTTTSDLTAVCESNNR